MAFNTTNLMAKWNPVKPVTQTMGSLGSKIGPARTTASAGGTSSTSSGLHDEDYYYNRAKKDALELYERQKEDALEQWQREQKLSKTTIEKPVLPVGAPPATYSIPEYEPYIPGAAPSYTAPEWNEGAIESLTQRKARPGLRELRSQIQRVSGQRYDNPQVGRMTLRDALAGYGAGIGSVLGGASGAARGEYSQKYGIEADVAKTNYAGAMSQWGAENVARGQGALLNYQSELEKRKAGFETAWNKWKAGIGTTTTNKTV